MSPTFWSALIQALLILSIVGVIAWVKSHKETSQRLLNLLLIIGIIAIATMFAVRYLDR